MGNISSSVRNNIDNVNIVNNVKNMNQHINHFIEMVDSIAAYYILTMNYKSLKEVNKKSYCNKLVKLISNIIDDEFNDIEVICLKKRIHEGAHHSINKTNNTNHTTDNVGLNILDITEIDVFDIEQQNIKKMLCDEIATFYVKLAHIFGSIMLTINPVYSYQDKNGKHKKSPLSRKDKIPKNVERNIHTLNICNKPTTTKGGNGLSDEFLKTNMCDVYNSSVEPKIQEIRDLYLDSNYDYESGQFLEMSPEMKKTYDNDLELFYITFSGNQTKHDDINAFSDIPLSICDKNVFLHKSILKNQYSNNDGLFVDYANNIKQMIQKANMNQQKLLHIMNEIFSFLYVKNSENGENEKQFRINPTLTTTKVREITEKTRKLIIDLYINCELDYLNGAKIFEALVSSKILDTTKKQIEFLEKEQMNYF
jgi:hypothetical protein